MPFQDPDAVDPNRVGGPVDYLLKGGGLSTVIGDSKSGSQSDFASLKRLQTRIEDPEDMKLKRAFATIDNIAVKMNIMSVVREQARVIYGKVHGEFKNKNLEVGGWSSESCRNHVGIMSESCRNHVGIT